MFRQRKGEFHDLEARLRAGRPQPPEELVRSLRAGAETRQRTAPRVLRIVLAAAFTLMLAVAVLALGGVSRGAEAAGNAVTFVRTGSFSAASSASPRTQRSGLSAARKTSGGDQYPNRVVICHVGPHRTKTMRLPKGRARQHLRQHPFDYEGPCQ